MNSMPLFSVIIPTYHRNDLLAKCLGLLAPGIQTLPFEQYEVIVTDDGSQATAEQMIREHYPWVKWVAASRKGPAANRNNGAKYAQGKWLVFTDDDCLPHSSWLSAFSSAITLNICVYEGKTTCEAGIHSPLEHAPINLTGGYLWSCNMLIRASCFHDLGGFDENFPHPHMEDVDLRERIKLARYSIAFVENAVVDHPPRKLPWGNKLGALQESLIYLCNKKNQTFSKAKVLNLILKTRLKAILLYPISWDSFKAAISLTIELSYVYFKLKHWNKKYSN